MALTGHAVVLRFELSFSVVSIASRANRAARRVAIRGKLALCLRPSVFRPCTPLVFVQSHVSATARNLKAASGREVFHCTCLLLTQSGHEQVRFCRDTRPALRPATLTKESLALG